MVAAQTVPVLESKLIKYEQEHEHLAQIRQKTEDVEQLQLAYDEAADAAKKAKKALEEGEKELRVIIKSGPPKADPQQRLPFAEDAEPEVASTESSSAGATAVAAPPAAEPEKPVKLEIPPDIAAIDISEAQKEKLVRAGCKTLADVIDLGNCNWPDKPQGFGDLDGFGPKAVAKLKKLMPSTAPAATGDSTETKIVRVKLLTYAGESPNLEPGKEYDATELPNGNVILQLPNSEPIEFGKHEVEKVPMSPA